MGNSRLKEAFLNKAFVITAEVGPPKGTNLERFVSNIEGLKGIVNAINVTDHQRSMMRYPSIGGCLLIKEAGAEPVLQMTCRDRNRIALGAELLFASSRGISNVLCLTGDSMQMGDQPQAKSVFDLDSVQLIHMLKEFESGRDFGGNILNGKMDFFIGSTVTPEAEPVEPQLLKFEKKVKAGAEFFQTQAVYDMDKLRRFMEYCRSFPVKILAGIVPLTSLGMAHYMNKNVPGIHVPQTLIDEMMSVPKGEQLKKGIEIAVRQIKCVKDEVICDGVHVMAIGKEEIIPQILSQINQ